MLARLAILLTGFAPVLASQGAVDFGRDVKPLLADRCFTCHGPDAGSRKADLRLDRRDSVFGERTDPARRIVAPGQPDASELYRRIASTDPDEHMPPPSSKLPRLTEAEIALVRRWIEAGAPWDEHWSLRPLPRTVAVPEVERAGNAERPAGNEIDAFVRARLDALGLRPSPAAADAQLLRRVTFDLTGLPPTLAELDAFESDPAPDRYERAVDRLLASPRLGERLASDWLDVARYADTHGYQADRYRAVWPWRDWVVDAFNEGLPYDEFLRWQIAGDLLPRPTRRQRLATTFNRLHRQTEEGGTIEEEFRVEYVADRTETFAAGMLGLTLGCARCHDHKYDPLLQREYYAMFAFFQNIDESGQTSHFTDAIPVPALLLADDAKQAELDALDEHLTRARAALADTATDTGTDARFAAWLASRPAAAIAPPRDAFTFDAIGPKAALVNARRVDRPGRAVDAPQLVDGRFGQALALDGENGIEMAKVGDFTRSDAFSIDLWLRLSATLTDAVVVHKSRARLDAANRGYEISLEGGRLTALLAHMWPGNALKIADRAPLPRERWTHVVMTYDGSSRAAGLALYVDGVRCATEVVRDGLTKDIVYERGGAPALTVGRRFRDRGLKGGHVDALAVFDRQLTDLEVAERFEPGSIAAALADPAARRGALRAFYLATVDPIYRGRRTALAALRDAQRRAIGNVAEIMTMRELPQPRTAFVLRRGAYDQRGEPVTADTPACLPPFGDRPRNRLGLAQWLTDPDHPLTARVAVNRYWQLVFGRGLVETVEDFGTQGSRPSHPQLLDWLARRFVSSGWNVKTLLRLFVTSSTYRQTSRCAPALRERDPDNVWLARAPRYRLPAEMIRDGALLAADLLVETRGGPPVKPYQPAGLWAEKSGGRYVPDKGDALHRRSLYTFWKRTSPPPAMIVFDKPRRQQCVVRRFPTDTPLQALVLWNDPQFIECARALAELAMRARDNAGDRAAFVFRALTARPPDAAERDLMLALLREQREHFAEDPKRADQLLGVGERARDADLPAVEAAAMTMLVSALLSYDEVITKR